MGICKISIKAEGYVDCKSCFYSAQDIMESSGFDFCAGINKLIGEIDSGSWAVSYLLSMYKHRPSDFVLFDDPKVTVNGKTVSLNELSEYSCYMDRSDPLFSTNYTVKELIWQGLANNKLTCSYTDVMDMFCLDNERVECSLSSVGNEIFRSMAAIGFSHKKEVYCFPWLSRKRFEYYHENLSTLLRTLESMNMVVILPVGYKI